MTVRFSWAAKALFTFRNWFLNVELYFFNIQIRWTFRSFYFVIALIFWQLLSYSTNQDCDWLIKRNLWGCRTCWRHRLWFALKIKFVLKIRKQNVLGNLTDCFLSQNKYRKPYNCALFCCKALRRVVKGIFVKRELLVLFPLNCEITFLFLVKSDFGNRREPWFLIIFICETRIGCLIHRELWFSFMLFREKL